MFCFHNFEWKHYQARWITRVRIRISNETRKKFFPSFVLLHRIRFFFPTHSSTPFRCSMTFRIHTAFTRSNHEQANTTARWTFCRLIIESSSVRRSLILFPSQFGHDETEEGIFDLTKDAARTRECYGKRVRRSRHPQHLHHLIIKI